MTTGNAASGVALLRQAVTEASNDPRVIYHYAVALKDTGAKEESMRQLKIVIDSQGDYQEKQDAARLLTELKGS